MDFHQEIIDFKENDAISSPIWIWFIKNNNISKCKTNIPRKDSSTGGMTVHLKRHHNFMAKYNAWKIYEELSSLKEERMKSRKRKNEQEPSEKNTNEPAKKQQKLTSSLSTKYSQQDPRQKAMTNDVGLMLCRDAQPTNMVGRPGFRHMVSRMDPRYTLPHPTTFARSIIPKLKETVTDFQRKKLSETMKNESSIAFTLDGLDCRDSEKSAVYSFSIYFYEGEKLCSEVVAVRRLEPPVTGDVVKEHILTCLREIKAIDEDGRPKVAIYAVSDEGSNLVRALKLLKAEGVIEGFFPCFNHSTQNVIKDGTNTTPGMQTSLQKFRDNAFILNRSKNERKAYKKLCNDNNVCNIVPAAPNETRWFAVLFMLEGFLKAEAGMRLYTAMSDRMTPLTAADWKNARGYVDILKPFHCATKIEEGENYHTAALIIPVLSILHNKTQAYINNRNHNGFGISFARNILASLEDRFGPYPQFLLLQPQCLATITDPRFKWVYFSGKREIEPIRETVVELLSEEMTNLPQTTSDVQAQCPGSASASASADSFWGEYDSHVNRSQDDSFISVESEINMWAGASSASRMANPVPMMDGLKRDFPRVCQIFRKFSIMPATQNKDERLFSMVGRNTGPLSRSIKVETLERKVVVGSAVQKHGLIFNFEKGNASSSRE